jgi:UrcA family protein
MPAKIPARHLLAGLAAAGLALAAAPALAQTLEELTVVGAYGPDGQPQTISRIVDISDLDLRYDAGVDAMKMRIRDTARDICTELGRIDGSRELSIQQTCISRAVATARPQMDTAIAQARASQVYAEAAPAPVYVAPTAETYSENVSATVPAEPTYTTTTITNGPVPDTAENRARFGGPNSNGGRKTAPVGN